MPVTPKKTFAGVAGLMGMAWLGLTAYIASNQRKMVFNPVVAREVARPVSSGHRTRSIMLRAADGTQLAGWLMTPNTVGPHPAVLYFGGRSEEVSWVARDAGRMFPGMSVLAINYRGYGQSQGAPAELCLVEDGKMLFDWLAARPDVIPAEVAVVGRSLGSGVAVQVALARRASAVVLITPYDSLLAIAQGRFKGLPVGFILKHRFESIKYAPLLTAPTYVFRSSADVVVPHANTDRLVAKLANVRCDATIPESDHSTIPYLKTTQERIADVLVTHFTRPQLSSVLAPEA